MLEYFILFCYIIIIIVIIIIPCLFVVQKYYGAWPSMTRAVEALDKYREKKNDKKREEKGYLIMFAIYLIYDYI